MRQRREHSRKKGSRERTWGWGRGRGKKWKASEELNVGPAGPGEESKMPAGRGRGSLRGGRGG